MADRFMFGIAAPLLATTLAACGGSAEAAQPPMTVACPATALASGAADRALRLSRQLNAGQAIIDFFATHGRR